MESDSTSRSDEALLKHVLEVYGSIEDPLFYMIESASYVPWVDKDDLSPPPKNVLCD